jgi:hypothetical protein
MIKKINKLYIGVIIGALAPIIVFLIFYKYNFSNYDFLDFLARFKNINIFRHTLPAMLFINLGLVIVLAKKNIFETTKGIILSSVIYAIIFVYVVFL